jgi:hypothetical protein
MKLRAALASLLAFILLSFCSAASACQLRCDMENAGHPCHGGSNSASHRERSGTQQMDGVQHCVMTEASPSVHAPLLLCQSNEPCQHQLCNDLPAQLMDQGETAARLIPIQPAMTTLVEVRQPAHALQSSSFATPPQRTTSAVSLQTTTLRI